MLTPPSSLAEPGIVKYMNDVHDGALYAPPFGSHHVRDLALYDVPGTNPFLSLV